MLLSRWVFCSSMQLLVYTHNVCFFNPCDTYHPSDFASEKKEVKSLQCEFIRLQISLFKIKNSRLTIILEFTRLHKKR